MPHTTNLFEAQGVSRTDTNDIGWVDASAIRRFFLGGNLITAILELAKIPIVKIAAGAVIVASAVGVGVATGLIPGVSSQEQPAQVASVAPAPSKPVAATRARSAPARRAKPAAAPVCANCAVVEAITAVKVKGKASGAGAAAGGVAGLVVGNQIGSGRGKKLAKIAGAVGGAFAGHEIEKNMRAKVQYDITLRMDTGARQTITLDTNEGVNVGDHVKIIDNMLVKN